ncbi:MAG: antirestriction protein ArdA [Clostridiales bacterium]|jgi:hypothetical protein|nr:antirestriction protein ArdA [Clostridiales bacterium]
MFKAYVTNLGKYNEGELVGEWLDFPTTGEKIQETLKNIEIDGINYEEYFITDYDSDIYGVTRELGEYENLRELNYLGERLEAVEYDSELDKFTATLAIGDCNSAKDLINLTYNLDNYSFIEGVTNEQELGECYIEEMGFNSMLDKIRGEIPGLVSDYLNFDEEAIGTYIIHSSECAFENDGFVERFGGDDIEHYGGISDLEPMDETYDLTME